ncbi:hypothetical protein HRI_004839200 [Hibiscus trionum]|uniref:TPX2 C-terminal domain-containing protein n=1 Tax=Hibiscus trionum TaxID=183268 RepID=A0A9W7JDB8_HIBTR|nr:hypothetical protein HRI_004839200 [Hibiscus trionum]
MAAAGTEIHSFFSNTIYSSLPLFFEEISVILSQGSFSFGRYADDSTAWENKSVFTYNRRQEELEKIKALGVVAQKKAYFDEFFRNIRLVKENAKENGNDTNAAIVEKERKLSTANQIQISDSLCSLNNKEPFCQEVKHCSTEDNDATIKEGMKGCSNIVPVENSFEEASVPRRVERKSIASGKVKQTTNRTIKHGTVLKDKGNVASAIKTKAKVHIITTQDGMKSKPNPSLSRQASVKVNKSVISGKENTPNAVRSISRQITGSHSSIPRLSGLSKSGSQGSSSYSSSIRKTEAKPFSKRGKQETELPVQTPGAKVTRLVSSSSSSSIRKTEAKPCLKRTGQEKELPVKIPSTQVTRLGSSSSSSIRKTEAKLSLKRTKQGAQVTRLVSSSASSSIRKAEAKPKPSSKRTNQETKLPEKIPNAQVTRLVSSSASSSIRKTEAKPSLKRTKQETEVPEKIPSTQVTRVVSSSSSSSIRKTESKPSSKESLRKQSFLSKIPTLKERTRLVRDAKHASTRLSCTDKSSVQKLVNKIVPLDYAESKFDQTTHRQKKPCWR